MNTTVILFGVFTFLVIGLGFVRVIELECFVGAGAAWVAGNAYFSAIPPHTPCSSL